MRKKTEIKFDVIGFCKRILGIDQTPEIKLLPRLCRCGCGGIIYSESKYTRYLPGHNVYDPENLKLRKKTCLERYGYEYASSNPDIKKKTENTNIQRYGCRKPLQHKEFMDKRNETCIQKFGTTNVASLQQFKDKTKQTDIRKYGCECHILNAQVQRKIKDKNIQLYGVDNVFKSDIFQKKIRETFFELYGCYSPMQNENVKEKYKETCLRKYNVDNYFKTKEFICKCIDTCLQKYGVEHYVQSKDFIDKFIKSCQQKFGCDFPMQNSSIRSKSAHRYTYNNISFDSRPEICLYIYLQENNIDFEYQPLKCYEYVINNCEHYYFPDFRINNEYIEIKGDQFFDGNKMINPFNRNLDDIYECKHQCMLKNNVKILRSKDYQKYLDYVEEKYGKNYLKQFKNQCSRRN